MRANFEVFEISPTGIHERLLARLSVFDDAKAIAELGKSQSRAYRADRRVCRVFTW
jgi:hypothetical protein